MKCLGNTKRQYLKSIYIAGALVVYILPPSLTTNPIPVLQTETLRPREVI